MNKEKTLECLYQLGFSPEPTGGDYGYAFSYEGLNLLYTTEEDESRCLTFALPGIYDVTEENRSEVLEAIERMCAGMRYVQPMIMFDSVWVHYQHHLGDAQPTPELIEHMIRVLAASMPRFHRIINHEEDQEA